MTTFKNTSNGNTITVDLSTLVGKETKSLYIRTGFKNGNLFLSQRGNGGEGAGDVCRFDAELVEVNENLFGRIAIFAEKGYTYNVTFNDSENSNDKGFDASLEYCQQYIKQYNGTNESYFADYKGGMVQIVCNQTEEVVFETEIK